MANGTQKKGTKPDDGSTPYFEECDDTYGDLTEGKTGPRRPVTTLPSDPMPDANPPVPPPPTTTEMRPGEPPSPDKKEHRAATPGLSFKSAFTVPDKSVPFEPPVHEDVADPSAADEQKRFEARRRQVGFLIVAAVAVVGIVAGFFFFKGDDKKNQTEQEDILNQFTKGQLKNTDDLNMRINKNKPEKIVPGASQPLPGAATASEPTPSAETEASGAARRLTPPKTPVSGADSRGSNFHKDQEIIAKYEEINPAAAAAGSGRTDGVAVPPPWGSSLLPSAAAGSPAPVNNRAARTVFIPGSRAASHEAPSTIEKKENFGLHDVKLKAKLLFAVRSSSSSKIVAEALEAAGNIPIGAKFYGSASFANNRVYVSFDEVSIGGNKTAIQGTAIQGSDPGLSAEVIEISNQNQAANFAIGATKTAAQALSEAGSSIAGGAVGNMIEPHAQDIQKDKEASKMTVEYRVPAKTPFFIYFE